jgi:hypothetical protein
MGGTNTIKRSKKTKLTKNKPKIQWPTQIIARLFFGIVFLLYLHSLSGA